MKCLEGLSESELKDLYNAFVEYRDSKENKGFPPLDLREFVEKYWSKYPCRKCVKEFTCIGDCYRLDEWKASLPKRS